MTTIRCKRQLVASDNSLQAKIRRKRQFVAFVKRNYHYEVKLYIVLILCLYVPGFQRQVPKHVKILSEQSKKMKEQKERFERLCCGIRLQLTKRTVWPHNDSQHATTCTKKQ